jgi:NTE family protein
MGDYRIGYVRDPDFSLATAMATSAGFPVFIGAYRMKIRDYAWLKEKKSSETLEPQGKYYHLWDGGVYDNLGLEALYKIGKGLAAGLDFLVVSNASGGGGRGKYRGALGSAANLKRLLDIALDQVEALRSRDVFTRVIEAGRGVYVHIGKSAADIVGDGGIEKKAGAALIAECISAQDAQRVKEYPTTLRRPTEADFDLILRHGYENAKCNFARSHTGH